MTNKEYFLMLAAAKAAKTAKKPRKYIGEENETVTLKDCHAANMKIAKLRAGQLSLSDFEVAAPDFNSVAVR